MKKKIALLMAAIMLFGVTVGGTIAWLTAETTEVKNTFTVGDVIIDIDEFDYDEDDNSEDNVSSSSEIRDKANEYHLIPGKTYRKDPVVHIDAESEDCFLFVEVVNNLGAAEAKSAPDYNTIAEQMYDNNWRRLEEGSNIWYLADITDEHDGILSVDVSAGKLDYPVFEKFKVLETAVRGVSNGDDSDTSVYLGDYVTENYQDKIITIKAYAIQSEGLTGLDPKVIWAKF